MADTAGIVRDYRSVSRALDRVILPVIIEQGLTMAQFKALLAIGPKAETGMTVGALAAELGIAQPTASELVERLSVAGLVGRSSDPADRRRVVVRLTAAGDDLVAELRLGRRQTFHGWLEKLGEEDLAALARGLAALAEVERAQSAEAAD